MTSRALLIISGSPPRIWTPNGLSSVVEESIFNVVLFFWTREWALIISVNASPHPNDLLSRRKGRSLIPAMGARTRGEATVRFPIESIALYYTSTAVDKDPVNDATICGSRIFGHREKRNQNRKRLNRSLFEVKYRHYVMGFFLWLVSR